MNRPSNGSCFVALYASFTVLSACPLEAAAADLFSDHLTQPSTVLYNFSKNPSLGELVLADGSHFGLSFKQRERMSKNSSQVAEISIDGTLPFDGKPTVKISISSQTELKKSTAYYKAAISCISLSFKHHIPITPFFKITHSFDLYIQANDFHLVDSMPVIFEEFWQGSPFGAPVSLLMISHDDALRSAWNDVGPLGNFILEIKNDQHAPLNKVGEPPLIYDLGPIATDKWVRWSVIVVPSPLGSSGSVTIVKNGQAIEEVSNVAVGFNPTNQQYQTHKPRGFFPSVDVLLYRQNGGGYQAVNVADISLSVARAK